MVSTMREIRLATSSLSWQARAACRPPHAYEARPASLATHVARWFPDEGQHVSRDTRDICRRCPVATECVIQGLLQEAEGVWGGLTQLQLTQMRSMLGVARRGHRISGMVE